MESKLFELVELADLALALAAAMVDFFDEEDLIETEEEVNEADL